ncbi:hypothetical protein FNV43_RR23757 [Rhamnella rubrinervis]|uniref:EF-hand domain-containing protein n=1 Tax=Rhamnella rubrinervis TaxID=2594499 RepID=A0A8K0GSH6_9ROSA|nr:hypothetical protein FNV43_RR23757 [Rhamnella rubrinervis]
MNMNMMKSTEEASSAKLDGEQIAELREIFRSFDCNKDESWTQLELGSLLRSLGLTPSPDQLDALILKADMDGDGRIDFHEFTTAITSAAFDNYNRSC